MSDPEAIGAAIRAARKESGISQEVLAELAGISERTVRSIESGSGSSSLAAVSAAANALGLRLAAL
ncbi:helix-turn-helix domain-containing protein [Sinomonas halotolerans]|uniref:Helix-turn-helix domain-containing protein n=1 Tax=Sinomonas halotolerans TaxID=1644133 RepID=A0ABU9WYU5_9MICC